MFNEVEALDFPQLEERVLSFWKERRVFDKLREQNRGGEPYSFLDGPITANNPRGLGVHHAWAHVQGHLSTPPGHAGVRAALPERLRLPGAVG